MALNPVRLALIVALLGGVGCREIASGGNADVQPIEHAAAVYVASVVWVAPGSRDAFVSCLMQSDVPVWRELKQIGLLLDESVFETTSVRTTGPDVPAWNFLLLSHLVPSVTPAAFMAKQRQEVERAKRAGCEEAPGIERRRMEVLRSTPNSNYPRPTVAEDRQAQDSGVEFFIEYIAVNETPAALDQYRESMRSNIGPAVAQLIRDNWLFNLIALETVSVQHTQPNVPRWNQIHVRGYFPDKGPVPAALDGALRKVSPDGGGAAGVFGRLEPIRKLVREDIARQLLDLSVR